MPSSADMGDGEVVKVGADNVAGTTGLVDVASLEPGHWLETNVLDELGETVALLRKVDDV